MPTHCSHARWCNSDATRHGKVRRVKTVAFALAVASLGVLSGCSTVQEAIVPTGTWWGYAAPSSTGSDVLLLTYDRVACNTARARYVRRIAAPVYVNECRQLHLEKGDGYWVVPAADVDGYVGSRTLQECEAVGRRQFSDYGQGDRVCQSVRVDLRD
jgi:hypothetical protein